MLCLFDRFHFCSWSLAATGLGRLFSELPVLWRVGEFSRGISRRLDHVTARKAADGRLWIARPRRLRKAVLARMPFWFLRDLRVDGPHFSIRRVFLRKPCRTWRSDRKVGVVLGRFFYHCRIVRGISFPRLLFVHFGRRCRVLARRPASGWCVRMGSQAQLRRGLDWSRWRGFRGFVLEFHAKANGKPVVRAWHARGVRFRRNLPVFRSGQRNDFPWSSFERDAARPELADGRHTWTRSQCFRFLDPGGILFSL